jgi:hypothetical protein
MILRENNMNILVSTICFINFDKPGAEIYATFANRLIEDVINKTPWDIRVATNAPEKFQDAIDKYGSRVSLYVDTLENNKVAVGAFNQLLKYFALKDVPMSYDWVLYLDCDAGFRQDVNHQEVLNHIANWEAQGYDALGVRTNAIVRNELADHERQLAELQRMRDEGHPNPWMPMNLFTCKFNFYNITSQNIDPLWLDASMPSEHFLFLKNSPDGKLQRMSDRISEFNKILIAQPGPHVVIADMEAFELGVSAKVAGYNMGDAGDYGHNWLFAINFNGNNWEKIKL